MKALLLLKADSEEYRAYMNDGVEESLSRWSNESINGMNLNPGHLTDLGLVGILYHANSSDNNSIVAELSTHVPFRELTLASIREKPSTWMASRKTKLSVR
jgi:hypothetical protein